MKGFVMEEEDKLLQDEMCNAAEISRQLEIINMNTEIRKLEREEEEVENRIRNQLSNSGTVYLGIGNTQGLVPQEDSCYAEETDDSNRSEDEVLSVGNVHQSDSDSSKSSEDDDRDNESVQPNVKSRRDVTAKDLEIGDSLNTNIFQNKKIEMFNMLHTMKDTIELTEKTQI